MKQMTDLFFSYSQNDIGCKDTNSLLINYKMETIWSLKKFKKKPEFVNREINWKTIFEFHLKLLNLYRILPTNEHFSSSKPIA